MSVESVQKRRQTIFNTVATHLLTQNEKSLVYEDDDSTASHTGCENGSCVYRGPRGLKCAIGCLIPDHNYDKQFESRTVWDHGVRKAAGIHEEDLDFVTALQDLHDLAEVDLWPEILKAITVSYNLDSAVLNTFTKKEGV